MKKYVVFIIMCIIILAGCAAAAGLFGSLGFESTVVSMRIDTGYQNILFVSYGHEFIYQNRK